MFYFRDDLDHMDRCRWDKFNLNFEETQFAPLNEGFVPLQSAFKTFNIFPKLCFGE